MVQLVLVEGRVVVVEIAAATAEDRAEEIVAEIVEMVIEYDTQDNSHDLVSGLAYTA